MARYQKEILKIINSSYDHLTADQVYKIMKNNGSKVVLASVYNNLNKLVEKREITKVVVDGEIDRFDRIEKHDHLVCQKCGALADKKFKDLTKILKDQMDDDLLSYDLKVYYICPKCRVKK